MVVPDLDLRMMLRLFSQRSDAVDEANGGRETGEVEVADQAAAVQLPVGKAIQGTVNVCFGKNIVKARHDQRGKTAAEPPAFA